MKQPFVGLITHVSVVCAKECNSGFSSLLKHLDFRIK